MQSLSKKRVGIIRGGAGEHYAASLKRGGDIILHIHENLSHKYKPVDILIDRKGVWHINGLPVLPRELQKKVDVVWNTASPNISLILDNFSIPHVSPGSFSSSFETSKEMLAKYMAQIGVAMPRFIILPVYQKDFDGPRERYSIKNAKKVFEKFGSPWLVRSLGSDPNMGVHLAKTFPQLVNGIEDGVNHEQSILVEEFILGKVASVHSVPRFRGQDFYTFPPVDVFGMLSREEKEKLTLLAKNLHSHLGAKHYLKSNFVLSKRGKLYLLDLESTPNLKPFSHFARACESVGAKMHHVVEHILEQALG